MLADPVVAATVGPGRPLSAATRMRREVFLPLSSASRMSGVDSSSPKTAPKSYSYVKSYFIFSKR